MNDFPVPFGGLTNVLYVTDFELHSAITALYTCGHDHNFAVELDAGVDQNNIYVSKKGGQCVIKALKDFQADDGLLTAREMALTKQIADVWNGFCTIVADGPTRGQDLEEIAAKIHDLQHAVMANAAARAYPETFRQLGRRGKWLEE